MAKICKTMKRKNKQFRTTVTLNGEVDNLKLIADAHNTTQSAILRKLIEREFDFLTIKSKKEGPKNLENIS
jgi:hypothetical protein